MEHKRKDSIRNGLLLKFSEGNLHQNIQQRERCQPNEDKGRQSHRVTVWALLQQGYTKKNPVLLLPILFFYAFILYILWASQSLFFFFLNLLSVMEGKVERASSEKRWTFKRICVFCGSKPGSKSIFSDATVALGKQLVINHHPKKKKKPSYVPKKFKLLLSIISTIYSL